MSSTFNTWTAFDGPANAAHCWSSHLLALPSGSFLVNICVRMQFKLFDLELLSAKSGHEIIIQCGWVNWVKRSLGVSVVLNITNIKQSSCTHVNCGAGV